MSDINDLLTRIDGAITAVKTKAKKQQQELLKEHQDRQKLLKEYEKVQTKIVEIAKPRLEALAKRAAERVKVTPSTSESRRSARFEFRAPEGSITLTFSVAPDKDIKNAVIEYDLRIIPVLRKFNSHAEFSTPITAFNADATAKWLDDRIIEFVELFVEMHEGELYEKAEYVEDPIAKVKFPKFAAEATLEHNGQTYFFVDDKTKAEFVRQKGLAPA
jgi:YHS domain-containing protein